MRFVTTINPTEIMITSLISNQNFCPAVACNTKISNSGTLQVEKFNQSNAQLYDMHHLLAFPRLRANSQPGPEASESMLDCRARRTDTESGPYPAGQARPRGSWKWLTRWIMRRFVNGQPHYYELGFEDCLIIIIKHHWVLELLQRCVWYGADVTHAHTEA